MSKVLMVLKSIIQILIFIIPLFKGAVKILEDNGVKNKPIK